jgi:MOSC domain-containing protein YiiM
MRIVSVQVGRPRSLPGSGGRVLRTAFGKGPVLLPVRATRHGLEGDAQANLKYHGGPDQVALAYCAEHYPRWREELSWPSLPYGGFGENLTVSGADEDAVCIGDAGRCTGGAVFQVSLPRVPCAKISQFWRRDDLLPLVVRSMRIGWYLRVLDEGEVAPGPIELAARPNPEWTIRRAIEAKRARDGAELAALRALPELGARFR